MKHHLPLIFCLLMATFWLTNVAYSQYVYSLNSETTVIPLMFHAYDEVCINSSLYYYTGVDTHQPQRPDPYITTVECFTPGTYESFSYWSGYIAWSLMDPLQKDLHVHGEVKITVWISSTDNLGFFQGSGYGLGLSDIDEDGNVVEVFEITGDNSGGIGNIFLRDPTPYTLRTQMDYVFKKGHKIVFGLGFGSNKKGYTVNVFFDSPDYNSGASIQVKNLIDRYEFDVVSETTNFLVVIESNTTINTFEFNQTGKQIKFNASDILDSKGFSYCIIPKELLGGPFSVFIDGQQIMDTTTHVNTTHSFIHFTYSNGFHTINIVGTTTIGEEYLDILVTPASWSETLSYDECKTKTFIIENFGVDDLYVSGISESVSWLSIIFDPTPVTIGPGGSITFEVEMCSSNVTENNAVITILSDDVGDWDYEVFVSVEVGIHDIAIVDYSIPASATVGDTVELTAIIDNLGDFEENSTIKFYVNNSVIKDESFNISIGNTITKTCLWTAEEGSSTIDVKISPVNGETSIGDNDVSQYITIIPKTVMPWRLLLIIIVASFTIIVYFFRQR